MTLSTKNTPSLSTNSTPSHGCKVVIALHSRTEVEIGVLVGETFDVHKGNIDTSLLEFCERFLVSRGFSASDISHLGVVDISASFTSTRLLTILANMLASFGITRVALLPSDFFARTSDEQKCIFEQATFSDSFILRYNGMPNITTSKQ